MIFVKNEKLEKISKFTKKKKIGDISLEVHFFLAVLMLLIVFFLAVLMLLIVFIFNTRTGGGGGAKNALSSGFSRIAEKRRRAPPPFFQYLLRIELHTFCKNFNPRSPKVRLPGQVKVKNGFLTLRLRSGHTRNPIGFKPSVFHKITATYNLYISDF